MSKWYPLWYAWLPEDWFNIKMSSYQYRNSHYGDETILRPSYLHNGISYTGKMTSLYWIRAQYLNVIHLAFLVLKRECSRTWWRHQMETFSALLALCAGNSSVPSEFPTQWPVTRGFDVFFDLRPNKRLSKLSWGWWFETLSCSLWLWRHCNECSISIKIADALAPFLASSSTVMLLIARMNGSLTSTRKDSNHLHHLSVKKF